MIFSMSFYFVAPKMQHTLTMLGTELLDRITRAISALTGGKNPAENEGPTGGEDITENERPTGGEDITENEGRGKNSPGRGDAPNRSGARRPRKQ
jgi:hypothetical protein